MDLVYALVPKDGSLDALIERKARELAIKIVSRTSNTMRLEDQENSTERIKKAIDEGATELDCVINICAVKSKQWNYVRNEIDSMAMACQMRGKTIKVILETGLLTEAEISKLCEMATEVKVNFVKTSTGVNGKGATVKIVELLRKKLPASIKIKASGGIRDRKLAEELIAAGAERIGTSSGSEIINS